MKIGPRRGSLVAAASKHGARPLAGFAFAIALLIAGPSAASAETKYGGWYEVNTPLSIRPDTGPIEQVLSSGNPIMFVDMPVTKDIATVTLGDLRNGAYCTKPAMVDVVVLEHPDGDPYSPHTLLVRSLAPRALSGTQTQITWSIPTMRLRKGVGYSFHVSVRSEGCQQVRYTTWTHTRSPDVNAGTAHCATDATLVRWKRVWHRQGEGATTTCGGSNFAASMPTGWLAARPNPSGGFYISTRSSPTTPTGACVGDYDKYGGRWLAWRPDPHNSSLTEYVCVYTQYKPLSVNDNNGFYYALPWIGSGTNGAPRDMFLELGPLGYEALLRAHQPLLQYDHDEEFFADSAAEMTDADDNKLVRHYGPADPEWWVYGVNRTIADHEGTLPDLNLTSLGEEYPSGYMFSAPDADRDELHAVGDPYATAAQMRAAGYGDRVYGRVAYDESDDLWLQYWFFYYYNSFGAAGIGPHPGDWEMVQIRLNPDWTPEDVTYSQHDGGEACRFDRVEDPFTPGRPIVYVADGSHAAYTFSGTSETSSGMTDHHYGDGTTIVPTLTPVTGELHNFWGWPGRWGQDESLAPGQSPEAPRRQGKWNDPAGFHEDARPCAAPLRAASKRSRRIAARGLPRPRIKAALDGRGIRVRYRLDRRPTKHRKLFLRVVAHTANRLDMPASKYVRVQGRAGTVRIRRPRGVATYSVNASVYDRKNRRGKIATVAVR